MVNSKILRSTITFIILFSLIFPFSVHAAAKNFSPDNAQDKPFIEILAVTSSTLDLVIRYPENPLYDNNGVASFDENTYSHPSEAGVPDLPVLRKDIELPFGSEYDVEILDSQSYSASLGEDSLPAVIPNRAEEVEKCDPDDENCVLFEADDIFTSDETPTETPEATVTATPEETETETATPEATPTLILEQTETATPEATLTATLAETTTPEATPTVTPDVTITETLEATEFVTPEEIVAVDFSEAFPAAPVELLNTYIIRGHQVAQMEFWPVQYDPTNQTVQIYQEITVRINFLQSDLRLTSENSAAYSSVAFETLLSSQIINYNQGIQIESNRTAADETILIITPNAFYSTLSTLVDLKESQGHPVTLVSLSTTGTTPEAIKNYIQNAYNQWSSPPTYIILVGDVNNGSSSMPAFTGLSSQTVSDLYYGTVDGTDWIPDIFIGRLPARTTSQLNTMINNLIAYNNLTGAEGWVKKAAFLASNDSNYWQVAEGTQNYVIQNHTQPAGYIGSFPSTSQSGGDKLYAYTYNAQNSNVVNAINSRRALISYTGHGSRTSWGGPSFYQSNIRNISTTGTYSVVTSFACITGDFNETESFGETWLLQPNKGAVAFIGSSSSSFWGPDDIMERAMMDSLYSGVSSANIVSSFRFAGLMAVEASRPGTGTAQSRYYWESYNLLGDPSLAMLLEPKESDFTLSANPSTIAVCQGGNETSTVTVGQVNGFSNPVELSLSALPSGMVADFSANPLTPPNTSTLSFSSDISTATGEYLLSLNGTSGSLVHSLNMSLNVFDSNPQAPNLISPANFESDLPINHTFSWGEVQTNQTYEIQIALDGDFNQIILSQSGLSQPAFSPSDPLENSTTYYWRVRSTNPCGSSNFSPTSQFRTIAAPGECPINTLPTPIYQTDFENTSTDWQHFGTNDTWVRNTSRSLSPNYAFFSQGQNTTSSQNLISPLISLPETFGNPVILKFWQWFNIESNSTGCFDGALLEISNDGGKNWSQVDNTKLLTSPYSGTISTSYGNPMGGRQAWCGSRDWSETIVDLTEYAGQDIILRFIQASDGSIGLEGWYVDDFSVSACEDIPDYQPQFNTSVIAVRQAPGQEVIIHVNLTNAGLNTDVYSLNLTSSIWVVDTLTRDIIELAPEETTTLEISFTIPADAEYGQTEYATLSVTSDNDPESPPANDTATIELKAARLSFLPLVSNQ